MLNQYSNLSSFVVESDIINTLLSTGIIGFILFYGWLIAIMLKGKRINWKYTACIGVILIEGIAYEVQMDWVIVFEIIMMISIRYNIDIFDISENSYYQKININKIKQVIECI